ncbi:MAG TPA: hypothetical protein VIM65_03705 [Cyclobacteriaceae bacterium]
MENKNRKSAKLIFSALLFACAAFIVSSCSKNDDEFSSENLQTSSNESAQESSSDEIDDMATVALNSSVSITGRVEIISDDRFICDGTTVVFSDVSDDKSSGTVTITFGPNGCTDKKGNVRKGQIIIHWTGGLWFHEGSVITITLNNYSINDLAIAGTRTISCTAFTLDPFSVTWNVEASHTFTWPDATTATRAVNKTKKWEHTLTEDTYTVTNGPGVVANAASGTNRHGNEYTVSITTPLVYLGSCIKANKVFMPVSGVKVITNITKSKTITIDYGNGDCDNTFTVSVDGKTKQSRGKNDSSND